MTVYRVTTIHRYVGLDADSKPEGDHIPIGSRFLEADDAAEFVYVGQEYHAEGVLVMADQPDVDDEIDIGDTTYTFVAQATMTPVAGNIRIGTNQASATANIIAAINGSDGWNTANPDVTAELVGADVRLVAQEHGAAGNAIPTVYTADDDSANAFSDGTLLGGFDAWQALP